MFSACTHSACTHTSYIMVQNFSRLHNCVWAHRCFFIGAWVPIGHLRTDVDPEASTGTTADPGDVRKVKLQGLTAQFDYDARITNASVAHYIAEKEAADSAAAAIVTAAREAIVSANEVEGEMWGAAAATGTDSILPRIQGPLTLELEPTIQAIAQDLNRSNLVVHTFVIGGSYGALLQRC